MTPGSTGFPHATRVLSEFRDILGEGPVWDARARRLLHVDINRGTGYSWNEQGGQRELLRGYHRVSALLPRARGGLVVAAGHELIALDREGVRATLAIVEDNEPRNRFNDCRCDSRGRLWAGTMSMDRIAGSAGLYRLVAGEPITCVVPSTTLSNGLGWSPTDERMYFIDSVTQRIDVFDFDAPSGTISGRRIFVEIDPTDGLPDGLTVDAGGGVWVCLFGGAAIRRYGDDGVLEEVIPLPVTNPTCPTFGGADLRTLFITSARISLSLRQLVNEPLSGAVLALEPGVQGLPANPFDG